MTTLRVAYTLAITSALVAILAPDPASARNGRNAAFIGGLATGVVASAAVRGARNNYYYGAPGYAAPVYAQPGYRCY